MGSGQGEEYEKQHKTNTIPTTGSAAEQVSPETDAVYKALEAQLKAGGIKVVPTFYQLPYPAPSISVLASGLTNPVKSTNQITAAVADYKTFVEKNLAAYLAGEQQGESLLYAQLAQIYHECNSAGVQPTVVLAGYSQGAMVIHNVLNEIAAANQTNFIDMIKGAVLMGDPERVSDSAITNLGSAPAGDYGICRVLDKLSVNDPIPGGIGSCDPPGITVDVASSFSGVAYQVCDTDDIVCDTSRLFQTNLYGLPSYSDTLAFKVRTTLGENVHDSDYQGGPATTAGRRVARSLILDGLGSQPSSSNSSTSSSSTSSDTTSATSGSWTAVNAPLPANAYSNPGEELSGVSCASPSTCVAVGQYVDTSGHVDGLLLTLSDGSWTAAEAPLPSDADGSSASLTGVSCPSSSECVAVGYYSVPNASDTSGEGQDGVILTLASGSWTAARGPLPANADSTDASLSGVSCPSPTACVAVGTYSSASGNGLLLTLSGGSWTASQAPAAPNSSDPGFLMAMEGVSCASASDCAATGYYDLDGDEAGLLLTLSGNSWTAAEAPVPSAATTIPSLSVDTYGVSCPAISECMVTEGGANGNADSESDEDLYWALLTQSGTMWNVDGAPSAVIQLDNLSCPSVSECAGVGIYTDNGSPEQLQLAEWSSGSWTTTILSPPANVAAIPYYVIGGISCPSASDCVMVGAYHNTAGNEDGLLLSGSL